MTKIALIGGGAMGEAMIGAILAAKVATARSVSISDVSQARRETLNRTYKVRTTDDSSIAISGADAVVLAVKPQNLKDAMRDSEASSRRSNFVGLSCRAQVG